MKMTEKIAQVVVGTVFVIGGWMLIVLPVWWLVNILVPPHLQFSYWTFLAWITLALAITIVFSNVIKTIREWS